MVPWAKLTRGGGRRCNDCGGALPPAVNCRLCGQLVCEECAYDVRIDGARAISALTTCGGACFGVAALHGGAAPPVSPAEARLVVLHTAYARCLARAQEAVAGQQVWSERGGERAPWVFAAHTMPRTVCGVCDGHCGPNAVLRAAQEAWVAASRPRPLCAAAIGPRVHLCTA